MGHYRYQITAAVAWQIIYQLMRRYHHKYSLRILETHPGGGQYDCLSLYSSVNSFPGTHLLDFNLGSGRIHIWNRIASKHSDNALKDKLINFVDEYLMSSDPKDLIDSIGRILEHEAKTSGAIPSTTPPVLVSGFISGLMQQQMLSRNMVDIRSGWFDSSGMDDCGPRKELRLFSSTAAILNATVDTDTWKNTLKYWLVFSGTSFSDSSVALLLDMNGIAYFPNQPGKCWNLWDDFMNNGRNLSKIISRLEDHLHL
jgi:hypothetical protein